MYWQEKFIFLLEEITVLISQIFIILSKFSIQQNHKVFVQKPEHDCKLSTF